MGGSVGMLALFLLQVWPASSFGKVPLTRPSTKEAPGGATPASTSSVGVGPMRWGWAHTPAGTNRGALSRGILWEEDGRGSDHGWARFAGKGTADVDGKNKKSAAAAGRAAKKSSGTIGGWDWGFKSTPKKAAATLPAEKKTAPTAESKAKRKEEAKAEEAAVPEQGTAAAEATEKEQKDAAKAKLAQDKAKAEKRAEEEAAAMKAARIAQAKRAEEIAAMARGDVAKPAAKKAGSKPTATKDKDDPSTVEAADPGKATVTIEAEPAGAEPSRAKSAKAETASTKKKSSGGGMGGWDWGFTPAPKAAAKPPAKPATGAAKTKAKKTTAAVKEKKNAKKEQASADADAVASAAEGAEKKAADNASKAKAAEEKAAATARAEEERAAEKKARKEAAAARAAQEKRAEAIAAKARGDVPKKPGKKKAPAKTPTPATKKEESADGNERKDVVKGVAKEKEAEVTKAIAQPAFAEKKDEGDAGGKGEAEGDAGAPADAVGVSAPVGGTRGEAAEGAKEKAGKGEESDGGDGGGGIWDLFGGPKPKESSSPKTKSSSGSGLTLSKPETIVVVTGATGRVGSLTVRRLLELYPQVLVRAVVNDYAKGCRLLKDDIDKYGIKLEVVTADLGGSRSVAKAVEGASAVVFCASGFAQNLSPIQRLANAVRLALNPSSVADVEGVREVATALKATKKVLSRASKAALGKASDGKGNGGKEEEQEPQPLYPDAPRFVLLSSAAVTRPDWSDEEKALYPLAADVPIVKLNPLNILTVKAEGEKELREVGIPYAVVRPCGLNDDHPKGRPLFSVGDTAAGRICREDVADVLVRCLATPEATGKTFEVQSLPGFEKVAASVKTNNKGGIDQALASLPTDEALENDPNMLKSFRQFTYPVLTQLRPVPLSSQASQEQKD